MSELGTRSDAAKVLLGCPRKGPEIVGNYPHDGQVPAGTAGCLNSSGEFVAGAANPLIGISRGQSMAHADKVSVTQAGFEVPLKLTDLEIKSELEVGDLTFTSKLHGEAGDEITIALVAGATAGSETVTVDGLDIVIGIADGVSTATQIKTAVDANAEAAALVSVAIAEGQGSSDQSAAAEAPLEGGQDAFHYVVAGAPVFVDDTTGLATEEDDGTTNSGWKYASGPIEGVAQAVASESADCALVNM